MLPLIPIAISLAAKYAPALIGQLMGDKAEEVAEKVVNIATAATGESSGSAALRALETNPEAALQFQQAANNLTITLYQEDTKRLEAVNATMREEARSAHWMQWAWRPFNGFMFGTSIFVDYFLAPLVLAIVKGVFGLLAKEAVQIVDGVKTVVVLNPLQDFALGHVPEGVYIMWGAILGVTAGSRGFEKVASVKATNGDALGAGGVLKAFGKGVVGK